MKLLQLSKPHLLVMVGIPGSGKSFFAEKFADTFQAPLVSGATLLESLTDAKVSTQYGERLLKNLAASQLDQLYKTDRTIVIDTDHDLRTDRASLTAQARKHGYETLFIWVQTDQSTAKDRSIKPGKQSTNKKMTADQHDHQVRRFDAPNANESTVVISGKHTYATQAKVVLKKLSGPRAESVKLNHAPERAPQAAPQGRRNISIR